MSDLFVDVRSANRRAAEPLAARMRPRTLAEFAGQPHLLGPGKLLRRMLDADRLSSVIFWGPPGTGKTTLADVIAQESDGHFERTNAAMIGVKDIRRILDDATRRLEDHQRRTILFLDEIHRFARNQQDVLLGDVESGRIILIGATTENPHFTVNSALISRSTMFAFEVLNEDDIIGLLRRAISDPRGFGHRSVQVTDDALAHWARISDGDARRALNALEVAILSQAVESGDGTIVVDLASAEESIQAKAALYDRDGDAHYDITSAFIKSMRGSDPDAALYWLARMLEGGEDPRFIARRLAIFASEDIGNADPDALTVAASAWTVLERIGLPEGRLTLSQATIYMACAPKSNACTTAIAEAVRDVKEQRTVPVPMPLRDAHYAGAEQLGHGTAYVSPHKNPDRNDEMTYLGVNRRYYLPSSRGFESKFRGRFDQTDGTPS